MRTPPMPISFEALCLQAAANGRGPILFGDCLTRVRDEGRPFIVGTKFPSIYLEFPLTGDPFLDMTVLYDGIEPGTRIASAAAAGSEPILDWFASVQEQHDNINFGFELDTKEPELPLAAIHFQPRGDTELVEPFLQAAGESERARLYLDLEARMPEGWPLSFFGLFRGRPKSPLRVCGYHSLEEKELCGQSADRLAAAFDTIGFTAYDDELLSQASELLRTARQTTDFQFDIYPDGSLGDTFAIDAQFGIEQPEAVQATFASGWSGELMHLLERWGIADDRWKLGIDATFARGIPIELDDGTPAKFGLTLMPQWVKVRWKNGVLQPSKLYLLANAAVVSNVEQG